ncbi:MAG: energy transducer TonB [Bradymonadia bacterium]
MTPSGYASKSRYFLPWSISLCLHLGILLLLLPLTESKASKSSTVVPTPPPLRLLSAKDAQRLVKKDAKEELTKPAPKPSPSKLQRTVSLSRITEEVANRDAQFNATVNNKTRKETLARQRGLMNAAKRPPPKPQKRPQRKRQSPKTEVKLRQTSRGQLSAHYAKQRTAKRNSEQALERLTPMDRLLHQTSAGKSTALVSQGTPEHIDGLALGDETILNTRAYKHGWFVNRVVGALYQNWRAVQAHRAHDPTGRIYGIRDRVTYVTAFLNPDGHLAKIKVVKSSGAPHLDDEAIAAFRRAQPFPNPPAELVEETGLIEFSIGFRLVNGKPNFFRLR